MTRHAAIVGIGSYLPEQKLTNIDLESMVDTSDEWIVTRTGISERRLADPDQATSDLGVIAATSALAMAQVAPGDVDLLVVGTSSPDFIFPSTAAIMQDELGLSCGAYDVMAACTSFVHALYTGACAIESGRADQVLVVGADAITRHIDFTDRRTCVLFGDGAGAVLLRATEEPGIEGIVLGTDGSGADFLKVPAGGSRLPATEERCREGLQFVRMSGSEVFKFAVRIIPNATSEALSACGHTVSDLTWLVPHQANQRIIAAASDRLGMPPERVFSNVASTGNTSAASIPLALDDLYTSGRLAPGDLLALVGFGAGLTWGAAIVRWVLPLPAREDQTCP
jgi:3-oxoacyl-[acyl-carrier-protein] synthase-3